MSKKNNRGTRPADAVIGQNLRNFRTQRGLSQTTLGDAVNVTFQQIQKYERGTNRVAASTLLEISKVLGVTFESFFHGMEVSDGPGSASVPLLSSQAYRLAVLYDKNKNPAFKKAVAGLIRAANGSGEEDGKNEEDEAASPELANTEPSSS